MQGLSRLLKWLLLAAVVGGAVLGVSYIGARTTAGKLLGPNPPLGSRGTVLAWKGAEGLRGSPRAWVFTYRASQLPGVPRARIYVSLTGELIATTPPDLDLRLEAWDRAREP